MCKEIKIGIDCDKGDNYKDMGKPLMKFAIRQEIPVDTTLKAANDYFNAYVALFGIKRASFSIEKDDDDFIQNKRHIIIMWYE